jgi:hypothetical protein
MSMTLRDDFRKPLVEKLADILSRVEVENNFYLKLDEFYDLDDLQEKFERKPLGKLAHEYVSENPLIDYFIEALSEDFQRTRKYELNVRTIPITEIEEYKDTSSIADRLVKEFESLPREYKLFIELPVYGFNGILGTNRVELANTLSLIAPTEEFESTFPPPVYQPRRSRRIFQLFSSNTEEALTWLSYRAYCEITVQGFIGIYEDTSPIKRASYLVRAFCGLSLALQLFETSFPLSAEDAYLRVYEASGDKWTAKKPRRLSTELTHGLERLRLHSSYEGLAGAIKPRPPQSLKVLKRLFSDEKGNERLLRAAQWFFDSYCGDNELLSFVKATICLEILLGDKKVTDIIGIMELLRNRCAYLIGESRSEREQILNDFNEIYRTRSNIVHSGQNTLTRLERRSLYKLRRLCARVIRKETSL